MNVEIDVPITPVDRDAFYAIDYGVMRNAFVVHNMLGRFCDERIYRDALAVLCRQDGFMVDTEVRMRVSHKDFVKAYFLDFIVNRSVIYELKCVDRWHDKHKAQLINYLMISGLKHGKLINFRPASVQSLFVTASMSLEYRKQCKINKDGWIPIADVEIAFLDVFVELLSVWGACLDLHLYQDALLYFGRKLGARVDAIEVLMNGQKLGFQNVCLLDGGVAWHLSAFSACLDQHKVHLVRLLRCLALERMLWFNLGKNAVTVQTLSQSSCP